MVLACLNSDMLCPMVRRPPFCMSWEKSLKRPEREYSSNTYVEE